MPLFPSRQVSRQFIKFFKIENFTPRDGLCIRCEPNEAGEFIGRIVRGDPIKDFQVNSKVDFLTAYDQINSKAFLRHFVQNALFVFLQLLTLFFLLNKLDLL